MNFGSLNSTHQAMTNAELAALLPSLSPHSIQPAAAKQYFRESGLWVRDFATGKMSGKLQTALEDENTPALVKAGINDLGTAIYDGAASSVRTDDDTIGPRVLGAINAMVALSHITQADADAFYALGGGRPYANETEQTIAAARTAYETETARVQGLEALRAEIENDYINPAISGSDDAATVRAAIKAGL